MLKTKSTDFSARHLNLHKVGVEVYKGDNGGKVWDNNVKAMIVQIPSPRLAFFGVDAPHMFKKGDWVVVGLDRGRIQDDAQIRAIDGNVLILDRNLRMVPKPGDVLCLLHHWHLDYIDTTDKFKRSF